MRIFIGYDEREAIAYHVLAHSIMTRASRPVSITPLVQSQLRAMGLYTRERGPLESTDFSLTRFLVPYLCGYEGTALFLDCDMLCQTDICELPPPTGDESAAVVMHEYTPAAGTKFLGHVQTTYHRKNWSSLMYFNNARCRTLTPDYVNTAPPLDLHRFRWCRTVEGLPLEWNWLVGEYEPNPDAKILHFTNGGPWHRDFRITDEQDNRWHEEYRCLIS